MLYKLANQPGGFKPAKLFSIDRVFRNEATDATHLAEFHQVEGVVADYDITLGHLIGKFERKRVESEKQVIGGVGADLPGGKDEPRLGSHRPPNPLPRRATTRLR